MTKINTSHAGFLCSCGSAADVTGGRDTLVLRCRAGCGSATYTRDAATRIIIVDDKAHKVVRAGWREASR